jgi:hypothetical protein
MAALPLRITRSDHCRAVWVLDLEPVPRRPRPVGRGEPLRHEALKAHLAGLLQTGGPLVTPARLAHVNISDDLPNGPHLEVNDAIQLRAGDTQVVSSCSETTLGASESHFAHIDGQLGNPHADASCHRPAMPCYRFGTVRHRRPPALLVCGCLFGRVGQAMPPAVRSHSHLTGSVRTRGPDIRLAPPVQCRPGGQSRHRRRVVPIISPTYAPASSLGGYGAADQCAFVTVNELLTRLFYISRPDGLI